jgi:hypothetical protein
MSSIEQLLTPIYDEDGIRSVNFFNGRLLSGEDLSDEQEAQRHARRLLGRASGEGVAFGLEVSEASGEVSSKQYPVISVEPGLAVNRAGQTLRLNSRTDVGLVRQEDAGSPSQTSVTFRDCRPLQPALYVAAESVYLLTLAPAEGREGQAPNAGYSKIPASQNVRYIVEGVQFRLIELLAANELGDRKTLRNRVAYQCFGVEDVKAVQSNFFGASAASYGLLDRLRAPPLQLLTDCETPLALIHWSAGGGIEFIDMWSVRRRVTRRAPDWRWDVLTGDRRASETEAMVLQFQDHIADMFKRLSPENVAALDYFRYLPPAGLLRVRRSKSENDPSQDFGGFDPNTFFKGRAHRPPVFIDGSAMRPVFREAINYDPIDLLGPETVLLYQTSQNEKAFNEGKTVQPFVIFTTPYMRGIGSARFNVAQFNYSNLAE